MALLRDREKLEVGDDLTSGPRQSVRKERGGGSGLAWGCWAGIGSEPAEVRLGHAGRKGKRWAGAGNWAAQAEWGGRLGRWAEKKEGV
jgi:hypothetical protein